MTKALSAKKVKELLLEGEGVRHDLEKRVKKMHSVREYVNTMNNEDLLERLGARCRYDTAPPNRWKNGNALQISKCLHCGQYHSHVVTGDELPSKRLKRKK